LNNKIPLELSFVIFLCVFDLWYCCIVRSLLALLHATVSIAIALRGRWWSLLQG